MPHVNHRAPAVAPGAQQFQHPLLGVRVVASAQLRMVDALLHVDEDQRGFRLDVHVGSFKTIPGRTLSQ
jgi:hypothetical protein